MHLRNPARTVLAGAISLVLLGLPGCRPAREGCVAFDFAAGLPRAEVRPESRLFDFGTPEARDSLLRGWSVDETWEGKASFVWGLGHASSVRFYRFSSQPLRLRFRCHPVTWEGSPDQVVTTFVNRQQVGTTPLARDFGTYEVTIPGSAVRSGENLIEFRYSFSGSPPAGAGGAGEARPLAVAWDWLALQEIPAAAIRPEAVPRAADGNLALPIRTRVGYFLEVHPHSRLRIEKVRPEISDRLPAGAELEIEVAWGEREASFHLDPRTATTPWERELPVGTTALARISFVVHGGEGLILVRPVLLEPQACAAGRTGETEPLRRAESGRTGSGPRPNVLVYLIDTLRADHLGVYGYPRPVSPHIDALASEGVVFTRTYAQSGWTKTSVASILTGRTPFTHRVLDRSNALPPEMPTLPSLLRDLGYETFGISTNPAVSAEFGFTHGFDHFLHLYEGLDDDRVSARSDRVHAEFLAWLRSRKSSAPFFAYLHSMDPHDPYTPPEPYQSRFAPRLHSDLRTTKHEVMAATRAAHPGLTDEDLKADFTSLYDAEIAYNDEQLGQLLGALKSAGLYASTLIVLVSDHGEEFLDHGFWGHGHSLYMEILHVPLIIKLPGQPSPGRTVRSVVQHVDLLPTILSVLGAPIPPGVEGESLLPLLAGRVSAVPDRTVLSLLDVDDYRIASVLDRQKHLLRWSDGNPVKRTEFFDLKADPRELHDRHLDERLEVGYLFGFLGEARERWERLGGAPRVEISRETEERLRALGYVH
jgi:arylsulfatase A-like enzyme